MPVRYDNLPVQLRKPFETEEGYLYGEAAASRVGIFPYRRADGSIRLELRPPDEVFHPDSLASLARKPITDGHPKERVNADNSGDLAVGWTGEEVIADRVGGYAKVTFSLTRKDGIKSAQGGKDRGSPGYRVDLENTPGRFNQATGEYGPDVQNGLRYDAVQRNIRYNHLALVTSERQSGMHFRLDADDAVQSEQDDKRNKQTETQSNSKTETRMKRIRIDGVEYEVEDSAVQAIQALQKTASNATAEKERADKAEADLEVARTKAQAEKVRADKAEEELQSRSDSDSEQERLDWYEDRKSLDAIAPAFKVELEGKTNLDAMSEIVDAYMGEDEKSERSDAAVRSAFKVIEKAHAKSSKSRQDFQGNVPKNDSEDREDAAESAFVSRHANAYKRGA